MMTDVTKNQKVEIPTLVEFIKTQCREVECRAESTSVENLNTRFNVVSDAVLVRTSPLVDASQQLIFSSLGSRFPRLSLYSVQAGYSDESLI